jgi:hypothetical protein
LMYFLYTVFRLRRKKDSNPLWTPGKCSPAQVDICPAHVAPKNASIP